MPRFVPWKDYQRYPVEEMRSRAREFYEEMDRRRSVRAFSDEPVPTGVVWDCLRTAGTAPSGGHLQPWRFVVVTDPALKRRIREAAEEEERRFYRERAPREWLEVLEPLGTDEQKPYLEEAPVLIAVFVQRWREGPEGERLKTYYATESVGLATGLLIAALHHAGLAALTHTPSPMGFLNEVLERPENEQPFVLLVAGYPAEGVEVPDIRRMGLEEIAHL